jgi:phosphonate transport system ATP-binding protein
MLQIKNLTKIYDGGVKALDTVSFDVPDGEFLAVIGLSGSGKSTLLRCINRLIEPTEGQILWNGEDITRASPEEMRRIRRKIGMVFQQFNLVHRSKVITNVLAGRLGYINPAWSLLNRFPKADMEKAIKQLERVGIADKANQRADELSGGQQRGDRPCPDAGPRNDPGRRTGCQPGPSPCAQHHEAPGRHQR